MNNKFPLSSLYDIHQVMIDRGRRFGIQRLGSRRILLNETLDYSSQKEFGGAATNFWILNGHRPDGFDGSLADPSEYTVDNGEITFHKDGLYTVDMRNPNVYSDPQVEALVPTRVILLVQVIDFVPVTEITNVPASVSVGEQYIFSSYRIVVLPENATYKQVNWEITDAGTTGATIFGTRLRTTAPGTVKVRGTIKEGLAFDEDYTQDFVIEIEPLGIDEAAQGLEAIEVYPNPTTGELRIENGELRIENVEIFDISGKVVSSHHLIPTSSHHLINISHLQAGTYFVKIATEQGEVVKKVIKQ
ncbi:MAG: T9SS type A sorting domain-containing protein [Lentimicrobiaceae bacterium]|nr:T9SS type A sorting domain-containing protein [Lentimicrobiaceae bacterium]